MPALADWYARTAISYLPQSSDRFLPDPADQEAVYACARSVAREIERETSVPTFAATSEGVAQPLGSGRYLVRSYVDEALEGGWIVRRQFSCTVRVANNAWTVESVDLEPISTASRVSRSS